LLTRRQAIVGALGAALPAAGYSFGVEPRWPELTHTTILCPVPLRAPVRILHLADLHASFFVSLSYIERAIDLGLAQAPDLICVTGDFITFQHDFDREQYVRILRRLPATAPAYAVVGNHDGGNGLPRGAATRIIGWSMQCWRKATSPFCTIVRRRFARKRRTLHWRASAILLSHNTDSKTVLRHSTGM
jgi:predicted MPP superfamily phosphohydrolase